MRFVHLGINPVGALAAQVGTQPPANYQLVLEQFLNLSVSGDWFRYASQNYVIWTNADLQQLATAIAGLPGFQIVYVFATEFTLAQQKGWMPEGFWQWLVKPR
jgi:hypothetical protein